MTWILGISAFYHDRRPDPRWRDRGRSPGRALLARARRALPHPCGGLLPQGSRYLREGPRRGRFLRKPLFKFERLFETYLAFAPRGFTSFMRFLPQWLRTKPSTRVRSTRPEAIRRPDLLLPSPRLARCECVLPIPLRGVRGRHPRRCRRMDDHQLGHGQRPDPEAGSPLPAFARSALQRHDLLHRLRVNSQYKVMGLAPYGEPKTSTCCSTTSSISRTTAVLVGPELLQLLHRSDHDLAEVARPFRW